MPKVSIELGSFLFSGVPELVAFDLIMSILPSDNRAVSFATSYAALARAIERMIRIGRVSVEPDVVAIAAQLDLPLRGGCV